MCVDSCAAFYSFWEEREQGVDTLLPHVFVALAEDFLRHSRQQKSLLRLLLYTGLRDEEPFRSISARFYSKHLAQSYHILADYVRERIREGVFRRIDPVLAARGFFGLVAYHNIIQEFLGGKYSEHFSNKEVSRTLAQLWLDGMRKNTRGKKQKPPRHGNRGSGSATRR